MPHSPAVNGHARVRPGACWATLVTDAGYLPGLVVFWYSLRRHGTRYPLVVMTTDKIDEPTRQVIRAMGCVIRDVTFWAVASNAESIAFEHFRNVWTKLRVFDLIEYDRVVLVDTDMLVRECMDELMDMHLPTDTIAAGFACTCNPKRIPTYPRDWIPENCAYTKQRHPENLFRPLPISPDSPPTHHLLNSGLVVLNPSTEEAEGLRSFVEKNKERVARYRFPDQELLAEVYWGRVKPLPWIYNALKTLRRCHAALWRDDQVRNVHYILDKPWGVGWPGPEKSDPDAVTHGWWWEAYTELAKDPARLGLTAGQWTTFIEPYVHNAPRL